ncbi:MAG: GNAT family N-acetyltransferase [Clostridia bacterium]|nr:GNAT family N-acetyltransferase [Clostridia bacterium]
MKHYSVVTLKDGRSCVIRNGVREDGEMVRDVFILTHEQTDYMLTYPDECTMSAESEGEFLQKRTEEKDGIELVAVVDDRIVGTAGFSAVGRFEKIRRRAEFGVGVDSAYWGLGIGCALTETCIELSKQAGYSQLELDVVADNIAALSLYKKLGFSEYGRNPKGFYSRYSGWQELVLMRLELH